MERGGFPAGIDHHGGSGENHICAGLNGIFHQRFIVPAVRAEAPYGDAGGERFFQSLPAFVMRPCPQAFRGGGGKQKGDIQVFRPDDAAQAGEDRFPFSRGFCAQLNRGSARGSGYVRKQIGNPLGELRQREIFDLLKTIDMKPGQKNLRIAYPFRKTVAAQRVTKVLKAGGKAPAFRGGPDMVRFKPERGLQAGIVPAMMEGKTVKARERVEMHELIIELDFRIFRIAGDHTGDAGRDDRCPETAQDTEPLVALLDIKASEVFIAGDGLPDAFRTEMRGAEGDPFGAELRICAHQRHKVPRQCGCPPR